MASPPFSLPSHPSGSDCFYLWNISASKGKVDKTRTRWFAPLLRYVTAVTRRKQNSHWFQLDATCFLTMLEYTKFLGDHSGVFSNSLEMQIIKRQGRAFLPFVWSLEAYPVPSSLPPPAEQTKPQERTVASVGNHQSLNNILAREF